MNISERMHSINESIAQLQEQRDAQHVDNADRFTAIEKALVSINAAVQHLDECLDDLKKKLFGQVDDGTGGVLVHMENRITGIEKWFWRMAGAAGFAMFIINLLIALGKK